MDRARPIPISLTNDYLDRLDGMAKNRTRGNRSHMVRILIDQACPPKAAPADQSDKPQATQS